MQNIEFQISGTWKSQIKCLKKGKVRVSKQEGIINKQFCDNYIAIQGKGEIRTTTHILL